MEGTGETVLECHGVWKVFGAEAGKIEHLAPHEFARAVASSPGLVAAVREVTLSVRRGECFCIMGLSGSGKSTLVRCMAGLLPPSRGEIRVLGIDIARAEEDELIKLRRHKIAMVFQDFALLPHLTAIENVAFPLRVQGLARQEREERARRALELAGLADRESYYPHELSGGQQQRVGIARSLTTDPELWFLDEPFSALDPLIRQDMQDELLRLQALLKKSVVFITHDFDEAIRLATRIAIMKDGEVVQTDMPEGLVLRPATDYVARFTRKVVLADIVTAGSVMTNVPPSADLAPIGGTSLVKDVAQRVLEAGRPIAVTDMKGRVIGALTPSAVSEILLRRLPRLPS